MLGLKWAQPLLVAGCLLCLLLWLPGASAAAIAAPPGQAAPAPVGSNGSATPITSTLAAEFAVAVQWMHWLAARPLTPVIIVTPRTAVTGTAALTATTATGAATPTTRVATTAATGASVAQPAPTQPVDPTLIAAGRQVYLKQYCGICHTLAAAGTNGKFGPIHDHVASNALLRLQDPNYTGKAKTAAEYIHESIVTPKAYAVPGFANTSHPMPDYSFLPPRDVDALVAFLLQQK